MKGLNEIVNWMKTLLHNGEDDAMQSIDLNFHYILNTQQIIENSVWIVHWIIYFCFSFLI